MANGGIEVSAPIGVEPTSAPLAKTPQTEEEKAKAEAERQKRFAAIRAKIGTSRLKVQGQPGKAYYWARKADEGELARLEYLGWQIVRDDPKAPRIKATGLKQDGTYIMGDVILLEMDAETEEFLKSENTRRADLLVRGAVDQFIDEAGGQGVPTFERGEDPKQIKAKYQPSRR